MELTAMYFASVSASGVDHLRLPDSEPGSDTEIDDDIGDAIFVVVDVHLPLLRTRPA